MQTPTSSGTPPLAGQVADDAWEASVSTWVDGEADMRAEELCTPYGRQVWDTYHLIGDVMRSTDLAIRPSERFHARLSAALDAEPARHAALPWWHRAGFRRSLAGLAAAAAVASVVWLNGSWLFEADSIDQAPRLALAHETPGRVDADSQLRGYLSAHRAMAGSAPIRQVALDVMGEP